MLNLYSYYWALRNEPKRIWEWWHRHSPITGKRYSLKEAFRAVWENPPCLDVSWDEDMERKPKEIKHYPDCEINNGGECDCKIPCQFKNSFTEKKLSEDCKLKHLKEGK